MARGRLNPRSPRASLAPVMLPPPPRRSRGARNPLVIILNAFIMLLVVGAVAGGVLLFAGRERFEQAGPSTADTVFNVAPGSGLVAIANALETAGLIDDERVLGVLSSRDLFVLGVRAQGNDARLRAGEYSIPAGASMREIMDLLVRGQVLTYRVTIPEGLTSRQVVACLHADTMLVDGYTAGLSATVAENCRRAAAVLTGTIADIPPEGTLLPDTYMVPRGQSRNEIVAAMQNAMAAALGEIWASRMMGLPIMSPEQLVIVASMIERETRVDAERARVAAVLYNRLRCPASGLACGGGPMRLDIDATVLYGAFPNGDLPNRGPTRTELDTPTPYNTRLNVTGLPAGPIANPGRASLLAAARPLTSAELFYVAAPDCSGAHVFTTTYAQHQTAVAAWNAANC